MGGCGAFEFVAFSSYRVLVEPIEGQVNLVWIGTREQYCRRRSYTGRLIQTH